MSTFVKVMLVILVILIIALIVLYFVGKRLQKKQEASQAQMEAMKQSVSMLIIDKKMLPLKKSGLPQIVIDQTPWMMRRSKLPIVKAKVGPRIMTLVADNNIFDQIPVKKEVEFDESLKGPKDWTYTITAEPVDGAPVADEIRRIGQLQIFPGIGRFRHRHDDRMRPCKIRRTASEVNRRLPHRRCKDHTVCHVIPSARHISRIRCASFAAKPQLHSFIPSFLRFASFIV